MAKQDPTTIFILSILLMACSGAPKYSPELTTVDWKSKQISDNPHFPKGDAKRGLAYMKSGEYTGSGVPWEMMKNKLPKKYDSLTSREVEPGYFLNNKMSLFKAPNGQKVISGNCFTCHSTTFNGKYVYGLGDTYYDFTKSQKVPSRVLKILVHLKYKKDSPQREAFEDFGNYYQALAPNIIVPVFGVNPAFRLAEACVQHRNPIDFSYEKEKRFETIKYTIATDVPPLWNVKKKNALYYNAMGRGDFTKLLMQSVLLGLPDTVMARKVKNEFTHVLTWLNSLEPPRYPSRINEDLAIKGQAIFTANCEGCHGKYGKSETYPNKVVALKIVKTDPWYAWYAQERSGFSKWYNNSWFALSPPVSKNIPLPGYIAPPLDGIWATAPYLHNGSVPNLHSLLSSKERPEFWERSGRTDDYDYQKVGWNFKARKNGKGKYTYDSSKPGYGNFGHYFGDKLTAQERTALIEYLKTI